MSTKATTAPKAFISYSWTSETHEGWVLELATRLMEDGVATVLDKWDLKVGHDAHAFMEAMVTDPSVTKVLMICDKVYVEKANGRMGGVGKEAQILTREIYEKAAQDKYAALITERDEEDRPYLPAYYGGRQFIDFSKPERAESAYEELLRWIWDKPQYVKPKLGGPPSFITDPEAVITATTSKFRRADEAIRSRLPSAPGFITDLGEAFVEELRELAPDKTAEPFDEEVARAAEAMRPGLRNLTELILTEARFSGAHLAQILRIFEKMGSLMYRPEHVRSWSDEDFDPYRMICYEGFLGLTAILLQEQRFALLGEVLSHPYLILGRDSGDGPTTATYRAFAQDISSFEQRKRRLGSRQYDLYADLIAEVYRASFPKLEQLVEAHILLFLRCVIVQEQTNYERWWPRLIIYSRRSQVLNLFARSESISFFKNWAPKVFGDISVTDFRTAVEKNAETFRGIYGYPSANLRVLTNLAHLGTRA